MTQTINFTPSFDELAQVTAPTHLIVSGYLRKSITFALYHQAFQALKIRANYLPYELPRQGAAPDRAGLAALLAHYRKNPLIETLVVSDPYKQIVIPLLDGQTSRSQQIGAVNLVIKEGGRVIGDNIDGEAFRLGLAAELTCDLHGQAMVFFGCGGVSSAVAITAAPLLAQIGLIDPIRAKAAELQQRLLTINPRLTISVLDQASSMDLRAYRVLYNGSGLGKFSADPDSTLANPLKLEYRLPTGGLAIDANYTPWETAFLRSFPVPAFIRLNGFSHMVGFAMQHLGLIAHQTIRYDQVRQLALPLVDTEPGVVSSTD